MTVSPILPKYLAESAAVWITYFEESVKYPK